MANFSAGESSEKSCSQANLYQVFIPLIPMKECNGKYIVPVWLIYQLMENHRLGFYTNVSSL